MTTYFSAVPLTMVRLVDGGYRNVLAEEQIAGEAVEPDDLKRLVRRGFLAELEDEEAGPPAKSASKGDWEAYARSQGATDEDLDGVTKQDLIDAYGDDES